MKLSILLNICGYVIFGMIGIHVLANIIQGYSKGVSKRKDLKKLKGDEK